MTVQVFGRDVAAINRVQHQGRRRPPDFKARGMCIVRWATQPGALAPPCWPFAATYVATMRAANGTPYQNA